MVLGGAGVETCVVVFFGEFGVVCVVFMGLWWATDLRDLHIVEAINDGEASHLTRRDSERGKTEEWRGSNGGTRWNVEVG